MLNEELPNHLKGQRTLAAILFTDAVSFSARMSADEEHTLKLIDRDLNLMANICHQFEGGNKKWVIVNQQLPIS